MLLVDDELELAEDSELDSLLELGELELDEFTLLVDAELLLDRLDELTLDELLSLVSSTPRMQIATLWQLYQGIAESFVKKTSSAGNAFTEPRRSMHSILSVRSSIS